MSDRKKLCDAVKLIAWGFVFIFLDFNINTVSLLPNWVGYILLLRALPALSEDEASAKLLHPLGVALAVWDGVLWAGNLFGVTVESYTVITVIGYIITVISMYFNFQLLTNLATAAEKYGCRQSGNIICLRTVNTVLILVLNLPLPWYELEAVAIALLITMFVVTMWICYVLFLVKKELEAIPEN